MLGACSGPYRRRFVRVRGLSRAFSGPRGRVSAGLRGLFSDALGAIPGSGLGKPYNCSGSGREYGSCRGTRRAGTSARGLNVNNCSGSGLTPGPESGHHRESPLVSPGTLSSVPGEPLVPGPEYEQLFAFRPTAVFCVPVVYALTATAM